MTANIILAPGLLMIVVGLVLAFVSGRLKQLLVWTTPLVALWQLWSLPIGQQLSIHLASFNLEILHITSVGRMFACAFILALWLGGLFALHSASRSEMASAFIYAGSAISVTLCGDLISLFFFWELMAITSTIVIWSHRTQHSWQAGLRYLLIHLAGGVILLAGIAGLTITGSSLTLATLPVDGLARWFILAGFLINAGAPPFSFWIADAYPSASPTGMVFLSAFTTKTAIYVLIAYFTGEQCLIPIGLYMAVYGVIYALRENNIRKILAYSIVNQVGFMVVAVGIGSETAIHGATAHAFAHILYKTVLVMGAGSVLLSVGTEHGGQLGNLFRKMPWTTGFVVIGAAASMGVPFTSSFITKSLILQAAMDQHLTWTWLILTACSAAVVFNAGVRFPWLTFFQPQNSKVIDAGCEPNKTSLFAIACGAALCLLIGLLPQQFYAMLPPHSTYHPYTYTHVVEQLQLLVPAALLFFCFIPTTKPTGSLQLDFDWLFRRPLLGLWNNIIINLFDFGARGRAIIVSALVRSFLFLFRYHGPRGILARSWPTGSIALWVALILASYVILYTLQSRSLSGFIQHSLSF